MFDWLAKMLMTSPIQGSGCSCCEGKKKKLEKMQEAIVNGEAEPLEEQNCGSSCGCGNGSCEMPRRKLSFSSGTFSLHVGSDGRGTAEYYVRKKNCNCGSECDCGCNEGKPCTCGGKCDGDDDVCHCGKGDDCCKKKNKK